MSIKVDLISDWERIMLKRIILLKNEGFKFPDYNKWKSQKITELKQRSRRLQGQRSDTAEIEKLMDEKNLKRLFDSALIHAYANLAYRISDTRPRELLYSKSFSCPPYLLSGLRLLESKIRKGESLFPHVSRTIFDATKQDGMLYDWGIYHFHLGTSSDHKHQRLILGTKQVLYAMLRDRCAYFLVVDNHGRWADIDLLRVVKRDFPEVLATYKINDVIRLEKTVSAEDRLKLRQAGVSTCTEIDGEHYFSPGGGINTARGSTKVTSQLQRTMMIYDQIQTKLVQTAEVKRTEIEKHSNCKLEDIIVRMESLHEDRVVVFDRNHNFTALIEIDETWSNILSITFANIDDQE